jgi:hypothetical protein
VHRPLRSAWIAGEREFELCSAGEVEATLRGSEELQLRIVRDLGSFTVSLFALSSSEDGDHLQLAGTGTLLTAGGSHYILTAAHVWHEVLKSADKVGITLEENIDHTFFMEVKAIVPSGPPVPSAWGEWGPDMILLRLPSEYLGSINARRVFYSQTVDGKDAVNGEHIEVWVLLGTPHALGNFTQTHADIEIRGFFVKTDAAVKIQGDFDYLDVEVDTSLPDVPQDFGGVSGGGLWKVLIFCSCATGKVDWVRSLQGVAFYQFPVENERKIIRCHGPNSVITAIANVH